MRAQLVLGQEQRAYPHMDYVRLPTSCILDAALRSLSSCDCSIFATSFHRETHGLSPLMASKSETVTLPSLFRESASSSSYCDHSLGSYLASPVQKSRSF